MASDRPIKSLIFGAAALIAVASGGAAHAAVSTPVLAHASVGAAASVTQVHWEWRHHHRYWVPDRRRDDHRDDRR